MRRLLSLTAVVLAAVAAACGDGASPARPSGTDRGTEAVGPMGGPMGGPEGMGGGSSMMLSSEFEYLTMMIPHHQEAIETAGMLKAGTRRAEVRQFADTIIRTQSAEIDQMRTWLTQWYGGRSTAVDYRPMMRDLTGLVGDELDRAFLDDMIPHHMMAVMMSQQLLMRALAAHEAVVPFATTIRNTQQAEIQTMRTWRSQWF